METSPNKQPNSETYWDEVLNRGPKGIQSFRPILRRLPSAPRCKFCNVPHGGISGKVMGLLGFGPSRKNPNMCAY